MPPVATSKRKILCVFPAYSPSFGTFENAYALRGTTRAFMPPQGLLAIAAHLPARWEVGFIDENIRRATDEELAWADAVFVSGMHVQRAAILDINARAQALDKTTVLGGPSVSGDPARYDAFDYLHIGELGDGHRPADRAPRRRSVASGRPGCGSRPPRACRSMSFRSLLIISLSSTNISSPTCSSRAVAPIAASSAIFPRSGRTPRLKTPQQVTAELDAMLRHGNPGAVYFVDDNFIAHRRAARELESVLLFRQAAAAARATAATRIELSRVIATPSRITPI
jgi:hypothetical protein